MATGLALTAIVVTPLLLLGGLFGGSVGPLLGRGDHPIKAIAYYEPSGSMEPTVRVGETVLVDANAYRFGRAPALADIVLFRLHTQGQTYELLKRVIGLPGQTVEIRGGVVYIDGNRLTETYLNREHDLRDFGPFHVPEGHLFVLGDNRVNSNDSRFNVGMVPLADVIGKVIGPAGPGVHGKPQAPGLMVGPSH
jgi:signal peptidase I